MAAVIDAQSFTESPTKFAPGDFSSRWLANIIAWEVHRTRSKPTDLQRGQPDVGLAVGAPSKYVSVQVKGDEIAARNELALLASAFKEVKGLHFYQGHTLLTPAAESATKTTERSWRQLRRARQRDALLHRLTPERRATYERIRKLREEIGPLNFDVVEELRELRGNG
jgi:hypothetical protein